MIYPQRNQLTLVEEIRALCPEAAFTNDLLQKHNVTTYTNQNHNHTHQAVSTPVAEEVTVCEDKTPIAEEVSVDEQEALIAVGNEAKGHLEVSKEDLKAGTHEQAMCKFWINRWILSWIN
eukprot:GHVR01081947.1.p1 GENE.GHVR01081947.1~~GHVR01081947.1.p1  ORF type:complete len:120 (+),score=23.68 GHVR01081947.1:274-633(+)